MPTKLSSTAKEWAPGQGNLLQRLRLYSGLVLFSFALLHFLNHGFGVYSVGLMEEMRDLRVVLWRSLPGTILLYGAALVHVSLALYKTAKRRTLRMPAWEALQLLLGILIPYYLIEHAVATRGTHEIFGVEDDYTHELSVLWPGLVSNQSILLLLVWLHGIIGIHYWLRFRPWYPQAFPYLLSVAVAIPAMALWGWIDAARRLWLLGQDEGFFTPEQAVFITEITGIVRWALIVLLLIALAIPVAFRIRQKLSGSVAVTYPGDLKVRSPPGATLLEISRLHGIPHASVCGGRARCSTCRTKIVTGLDTLAPPDENETAVLSRVGADDDVRLACQIRPAGDLSVRPLLPARDAGAATSRIVDAYHWGVEQNIAVMFIDIRSFTTLAEKRLSYDVVYVLNRYFDVMTRAIEGAGGYIDKFIGDGIMAIFGMTSGERAGCRQALEAAVAIEAALAALNDELAASLDAPLRIGVGIHSGPAILGRVGAVGSRHVAAHITALGDTVNTASRLETLTKEFGAHLIVSEDVLTAAGLEPMDVEHSEVTVRGRATPLRTAIFKDTAPLKQVLADKTSGTAEIDK